ncbi:peptide-methionine (S)-S-oxide reductase MsrA [Rhizobium sp. CRIBSB]|nr:peptide-methionine (S)-S-oxide reductase MsrA [Rhizobium sp. CRIBSB]
MRRHLALLALLVLGACTDSSPPERVLPPNAATATFAAGCFWCVEEAFEKVPGVVDAVSGYTGGTTDNPTYEAVSAGGTGHYEAVRVTYDPARVTYAQLLDVYWKNVDPFDPVGQFCDKGPSYRAAVFPATPGETEAAMTSGQAVARQFGQPVAVEILPATTFHEAEAYHQDYYLKNPQTYRFYKWRCGRAQRLEQLWGSGAQGGSQ